MVHLKIAKWAKHTFSGLRDEIIAANYNLEKQMKRKDCFIDARLKIESLLAKVLSEIANDANPNQIDEELETS